MIFALIGEVSTISVDRCSFGDVNENFHALKIDLPTFCVVTLDF